MAKRLALRVVTPDKVAFDGPVRSVVVPAWDGLAGVLPGHAPYLTELGAGTLRVETDAGERRGYELSGGVMKVEAGRVDILADSVGAP